MPEAIQWGVLGNATIARMCVMPAIKKSRNGNVHALGTRSPEKAEKVAVENDIRHVYDSYDAVLRDPEVDAVYIALPNHLHHPWTLEALRAGKHVLCEKPLACNEAQAQEMALAAEANGRQLMEAFMYRFHPRVQTIKGIIDDGQIGPLRLVRSAFCFHVDNDVLESAGNARLNPECGGGCLLDVGCYSVSLARWLFGCEPVRVQAQALYHPGGSDIHMAGSLMFPAGGLATIEASFISALQQTFSAVGAEGAVELPHDAYIPWERDAVFFMRGRDEASGREHRIAGDDEYRLMAEHFADTVLGLTACAFTPEDSVRNMRVLDALAQSAKTGTCVSVHEIR